ncbi:MAG: hypothetical protein M2R45_04594 [Verrucomicrobia subdivision 3 bacterium]|nr:hypothetical protein [Limisphaerales bacterium]MCS1417369.1 hypothetical protein [Limisphaerales bacterium]
MSRQLFCVLGVRFWRARFWILGLGLFGIVQVIAGGRLYVSTEEGYVYVLKTGCEFAVLADNDIEGWILALPAVSGDALIIRMETQLYRIETPLRDSHQTTRWL